MPRTRAKEKFDGRIAEATIAGEKALLLWPHTLMNRSGQSVRAAVDFYQLPLADLLVVCDDFNLPLGKLRFRSARLGRRAERIWPTSFARLGTEEFTRLRIGIGPVPDDWDAADFVLGRFAADERPVIDEAIARAADGVECGWPKASQRQHESSSIRSTLAVSSLAQLVRHASG